jgi:hypothetical protein
LLASWAPQETVPAGESANMERSTARSIVRNTRKVARSTTGGPAATAAVAAAAVVAAATGAAIRPATAVGAVHFRSWRGSAPLCKARASFFPHSQGCAKACVRYVGRSDDVAAATCCMNPNRSAAHKADPLMAILLHCDMPTPDALNPAAPPAAAVGTGQWPRRRPGGCG